VFRQAATAYMPTPAIDDLLRYLALYVGRPAEMSDALPALTGRPATINSRRYSELYAPGFVCHVDRMHERLGVVASVDLTDGVFLTAAWYRDHAWLSGRPALKRKVGTRS